MRFSANEVEPTLDVIMSSLSDRNDSPKIRHQLRTVLWSNATALGKQVMINETLRASGLTTTVSLDDLKG